MRTESPSAPRREDERARVRAGVRYCVAVFVAMRIGLTLLALASTALLPHGDGVAARAAGLPEPVDVPGWPAPAWEPGASNAVTAWERFDALWFLRIATDGYADGDGSAAFFPGYPMLVRAVSWALGGHPLAVGLLVANLAFLGALIALYFLTASERGEAAARRAVLYLAVFPTAFFFLAPYSESPFLLLALLSLWGARRGRWGVAGLAGAAAALTRNVGVLLAVPLAVEALHQRRESGRPLLGPLAWSALPALGLGAYLLFWHQISGDWLAPLHQQATWQREAAFPLATVVDATGEAFRWFGVYPGGYHLLDWLFVVPALAAAGWVSLRARPAFAVYTWAMLLAPLSFAFGPRPFMSLPRFLLVVFPLLWAPAAWAERRRGVHETVVAASAAGLGVATVLFVNWYFLF